LLPCPFLGQEHPQRCRIRSGQTDQIVLHSKIVC
jgi:hypothetical protein